MTTITDPTALADQYRAASRQAQRVLTTNASTSPPVARLVTTTSPWLAEQATRLRASLRTGVRTCPHVGDAPRVVHAAAWAPGVLVCPACVRLLTPDPHEDGTCDRCRRHTGRLTSAVTSIGPILFGYGLCHRCAVETGLVEPQQPS